VLLNAGGIYRPRKLEVAGPLTIRTAGDSAARIVVGEAPWELTGEIVRIENVELTAPQSPPPALARIRSRLVELAGCRFVGSANDSPERIATAIVWRPQDSATAAATGVSLENCVLHDAGITCEVRPSWVRVTNCLKTGRGALCRFGAAGRAHQSVQYQLNRTSVRDSGPLAAWEPGPRAAGLRIEIRVTGCVLDVAAGDSLLEIDAKQAPVDWERSLAIRGVDSIVTSRTTLIGLSTVEGEEPAEIDGSRLDVDGVVAGEVEFRGEDPRSASDSEVIGTDAVRSATSLPGITASKLPKPL
jgi:hypothetical protein